jgi:hypothetical protein
MHTELIDKKGSDHYSRLLYWVLGLFGSLWLLLAGAFLAHILQEQASTVERMNALERSQAALAQSREDQSRRLENIERKLSEINDSLRKLR